MNKIIYPLLIALVVVIAFSLIALGNWLARTYGRTVAYDCRLVEISPDIPNEVRDKCRLLRGKKL